MRHLVLVTLGLLWLAAVAASTHYRDITWLQYLFVDVTWIQVALISAGAYGVFLVLTGALARSAPRPPGCPEVWPMVSIVVPAKNEEAVIEGTVRSLAALDYAALGHRRFEIIVVDDRSTDRTAEILERLAAEFPLTVVRTPEGSRGKAAALNLGIARARADLIAVFDADARVAPDFLAKLVPYVLEPGVGGVQARRMLYNAGQNGVTKVQDDEYRLFQANLQRGRRALGGLVCFAGNGLLLRREALDEVGGWNEEALTEDIDLSVRFHLAGWPIRYCDEAVVWEEAVPGLRALLRQRTRWFEGAIRCLGDHLPAILFGHGALFKRLDMLFFLGGALLVTMAVLTTYLYALIDVAGGVVLYLQLPRRITTLSSLVMSTALLLTAVREYRRPWTAAAALARMAVFSLHRLVVFPLAVYRYVRSAITGEVSWEKTAHGTGPGMWTKETSDR
ncbi:MAG: glycosyltransferase family 2 protein [Armatimonadota bacterium]|nr:glycosyltransferase family 2 protein [Armatimonadota bacterium]MDR7451772.1 glycosyltransferase family 2 protein [Armatimonadota bacterium]MDR7467397.1 glycosyltransferase family 2 protein [Armatimonadota bacterium]MDR7494167.1 glycosyltransferase family 2 protein [Armatimonadota bacterium]MDR7498867.1 glycosyltransferase family 2 protein [Armatimonadota bacterium]